MKSILSNEKVCLFCHTNMNIHKHHIYEGSFRQASENNGFWCYLCGKHHNMSDNSVHMNEELNRKLKRYCQHIYEKKHTREEFMKIIHRNFL